VGRDGVVIVGDELCPTMPDQTDIVDIIIQNPTLPNIYAIIKIGKSTQKNVRWAGAISIGEGFIFNAPYPLPGWPARPLGWPWLDR